jgi:oxalate decarboxylase/phosphoglucose isomerase-like protein (cupin superfamily)
VEKLSLKLRDWGTFDRIGKGYAFNRDGKFYSILETKVGSYRGNHIHPHNQYTLLLSGKARYILFLNGEYKEVQLTPGEVIKVDSGIPHILIVDEDITTFEWWEGDFNAVPCDDVFGNYTEGCVGPEHYKK